MNRLQFIGPVESNANAAKGYSVTSKRRPCETDPREGNVEAGIEIQMTRLNDEQLTSMGGIDRQVDESSDNDSYCCGHGN